VKVITKLKNVLCGHIFGTQCSLLLHGIKSALLSFLCVTWFLHSSISTVNVFLSMTVPFICPATGMYRYVQMNQLLLCDCIATRQSTSMRQLTQTQHPIRSYPGTSAGITLSRNLIVLPDPTKTRDRLNTASMEHIRKLRSPRKLIWRAMDPGKDWMTVLCE